MPAASGGSASAAGIGNTQGGRQATYGTTPAGGANTAASDLDNRAGLAEKGLCSIAIGCEQPITDAPPVLCSFELRDAEGTTVYADHAAVDLRGRSSIRFPKKNYSIELRDASNQDHPANLLGMGTDADWVLDGAWADRSFMRNRLTFGLFRDMAPTRWAPQARYCELKLNGNYLGIYVLLEKIKRDDDRVMLADDDGTGSTFVVKQDDTGTLSLTIGAGSRWQIVYPKRSIITPKQTQAVQAWLDRLGAALRSTDASDMLTLLDADAVIDWILVEEFAKNIDAYNLSLYFARNSGGLAWSIPWDIDLAYGQPTLRNATNESPEGWVYNRTALIAKLSANPMVQQGLGPRWRALRSGIFSEHAIVERLDGYAAVLQPDAIARNLALWPIEQVDFSSYYAPYSFYAVTSYAEEVTHFRAWLLQRLTWLDANIDRYPTE